jgi:hypothetical protein
METALNAFEKDDREREERDRGGKGERVRGTQLKYPILPIQTTTTTNHYSI